jgi:diguanylate cyclase (GGDEF)-like protein/PAS domain S-box-containing protein
MNRELHKLRRLYGDSEVRCESLLHNSRDSIAYVHEGMHVYANQSYLELFGYENFDDLEGLPIMDMVVSDKQNDIKAFLRELDTEAEKEVHYQTDLILADESIMESDLEFSSASIDGEPCTQIIIRQKIEENTGNTKELEEQIAQMARIDSQTGLLNRQSFMDDMTQALGTMGAEGREYAYFHMRLDKFEAHGKNLGLMGADAVISQISAELKRRMGDKAMLCRYDGPTFSHMFPVKDRTADVKKRAQGILSVISKLKLEIEGKEVEGLSFSIGVCLVDDATLRVPEIIDRADNALQQTIKDGGNNYELYRPKEGEMTEAQLDKAWTNKLEDALKANRFRLIFQPIVKLDGGELERYEVLVRMRDEHGSEVSPGEFLPAADRTGVARQIDRWVISNAFKALVDQFKKGNKTILLIKLTASSLKDKDLFVWIKDRVKASGLPKNCLIFEVKEESVQDSLKQATAFAAGLQAIGCGFAIDDFGLSKDPFKIIDEVPAQFLKFDASLTKDLFNNQDNQNKITELSAKAHEIQKQTIIQHVEDAMTLSVIWTIGCDYIQGHFISGPIEQMDYDFTSTMG